MDKIKMSHKMDKTFEEGFEQYVLNAKIRDDCTLTTTIKSQYNICAEFNNFAIELIKRWYIYERLAF